MRQAFNQLHIKGSFLVIKNGRPWLNYATKNKIDTSYLINSVQKPMTAAMCMSEFQKHHLSLRTKIKKFYPDIPGGNQVTIENLLTMTSGLDLKPGETLGTDIYTSDEDSFKSDLRKVVFNPFELNKWHYTSLNYVLLCSILSKLSNKDYEDLFRATYIDPLNLKNTEFLWSDKADLLKANWVPGYYHKDGKEVRVDHNIAVKEAHNELGAGSIVMSNHDLAVTMKYILSGPLLDSESRKLLFRANTPANYNGGFYNNKNVKKANGAGMGYYTFFRSTNDGKNMIVIQTNHVSHDRFIQIKDKISGLVPLILK